MRNYACYALLYAQLRVHELCLRARVELRVDYVRSGITRRWDLSLSIEQRRVLEHWMTLLVLWIHSVEVGIQVIQVNSTSRGLTMWRRFNCFNSSFTYFFSIKHISHFSNSCCVKEEKGVLRKDRCLNYVMKNDTDPQKLIESLRVITFTRKLIYA